MKESMTVDTIVSEADTVLADLKTIEALGYPVQHLTVLSVKIESHLNALRRRQGSYLGRLHGRGTNNWRRTLLTAHCGAYWHKRDQMP